MRKEGKWEESEMKLGGKKYKTCSGNQCAFQSTACFFYLPFQLSLVLFLAPVKCVYLCVCKCGVEM